MDNAAMEDYLRRQYTGERQADAVRSPARDAPKGNAGIPPAMQQEFEERSGFSFDDVRVHYNSDGPIKFGVLAYAQGNEVHIGAGQEEYLRHELGHVVQQKAGMVKQTGEIDNEPVNKDRRLEDNSDCFSPNAHKDFILPDDETSTIQMREIRINDMNDIPDDIISNNEIMSFLEARRLIPSVRENMSCGGHNFIVDGNGAGWDKIKSAYEAFQQR